MICQRESWEPLSVYRLCFHFSASRGGRLGTHPRNGFTCQGARRSYGFDPLGLAAPADLRDRFQESELIHSRWAMAGVAGVLIIELLGQGNWISAQTWVRNEG